MWQSKKQRGPIFDGYLVFAKFMPFCAPGFLCICKFTSIYMKARYDLDLSHIKNQPPCLTITSCEVGMKHRFEESLKETEYEFLFNIPRLENEHEKPSSEETVLPNPQCLILIYVSSMVVLGWCSCVYKPFLGLWGDSRTLHIPRIPFRFASKFWKRKIKGDTPLSM